MKIFKLSAIASSAAVCLALMGCNSEEEVVPEVTPAKKVEAPKPAPQKVEQPKAEEASMPELQSIQSLADSSAPKGSFSLNADSLAQPGKDGAVTIQVSIQTSKKNANAILQKLEEKGIHAYIAQVENPGELEGTFYRVRVGYFKKIEEAKAYVKAALEPNGFTGWIDNKANDSVGSPESEEAESYNSSSYNTPSPYTTSEPTAEELAAESSASTEAAPAATEEAAPAQETQVAEQPAQTAEAAPAPAAEQPAPAPAAEPAPAPEAQAPAEQAQPEAAAPAQEAAPAPAAEQTAAPATDAAYDDWD